MFQWKNNLNTNTDEAESRVLYVVLFGGRICQTSEDTGQIETYAAKVEEFQSWGELNSDMLFSLEQKKERWRDIRVVNIMKADMANMKDLFPYGIYVYS